MNVLIIGQYFPPDMGGASTRAYNIAKGLVLNGCNVTVITAFPHYPHGKIPDKYKYKPFKIEWFGKIRVIRTFILPLESKGIFNRLVLFGSFMLSSLSVSALVRRVDVVWAANPDVFSLLPSAIYGMLMRGIVVSNVDDLIIEDLYDLGIVKRNSFISKIAETLARLLFGNVKGVTPISYGYTTTLVRYGVDRNSIHLIRSGVDLDLFKPCEHTKNVNRKFVVLYSGGFSVAYNFEQVFNAAKIIENVDENIEFVVQGKGELLDSMRSKVDELNVKNVRIVNKLLNRNGVSKLLSHADVLLLPLVAFNTPYRGLSSKLYEYQAVAKPIICCSNGVPQIYVKETKSGLVVTPGDYKALANAVIELKRNPDLARMMGENGRKYVEREASIEAIGSKMKKTFELLSCKV
ncbi:MAG: glycosyltransferase family 4 protein [archaeon]